MNVPITLLVVFIWVLGIVGWIWNIVKIVHYFSPTAIIGAEIVLRCIGIFFPPLGAILGYC